MRAAAFFDLDRTVLRGASGPLVTGALVKAGLVPAASLRGQGLLYRFYDLVGETLPAMALARLAASASKGWAGEDVRQAGKAAAEELEQLVAPYVKGLLDRHRAEGRPVVLATTTPHDLVAPLAERLGFDDVIATRYASTEDGAYTGALEGEFVWATGKLAAVRRWASENDVDVSESWAYSDSIYDLPLLWAVANPRAVNPDPRLRAFATAARWPVIHLDAPPGVPQIVGVEPLDVVRVAARPLPAGLPSLSEGLFPYARFSFQHLERIPAEGPAIVVANHRSYFDPVVLGMAVLRAGRLPRFLGKKEVLDAPVLGALAKVAGTIRVDRGSGSDEPLRRAAQALDAGEVVVIMPQGTIPRGEAFFDPVLKGKTGAARLAAMTDAAVIPVGLWATELVWPRSERIPRVWNVLRPPRVIANVGEPVEGLDLGEGDAVADTERIMGAIVNLLPAEAKRKRPPTESEIKKAKPPT
ncbi:MAG: HAD-IB family hydrolase [Actinobacteria bacterium]|nr:HAD-IB family hydrolase [Actinomycetota bacterium]